MISQNKVSEAEGKAILKATVFDNPFIPYEPSLKQAEFLINMEHELMFGGAAGPGKSVGLLMAALQFVEYPDYAALLLRRTYSDLSLAGALMDKAFEILAPTAAHWNDKKKRWTFPSGAIIEFGYLENEKGKYRYQGSGYNFIGFDELTQFLKSQYTYLFRSLRKVKTCKIPSRMRSATNPGNIGHEWVEGRFVIGDKPFIPALLGDNPYINSDEYIKSLMELDYSVREALLKGSWKKIVNGGMFKRQWYDIIDVYPVDTEMTFCRYWDMASTLPSDRNPDPDWTRGILLGRSKDGIIYVCDVKGIRNTPYEVQRLIRQTAVMDGKKVTIILEQEPGSSGVNVIDHYRREVLPEFRLVSERPTGSKAERAGPISTQSEAGNVKIVKARWNEEFLSEIESFPNPEVHDDQVDCFSGSYNHLAGNRKKKIRVVSRR